MTFSLALSWNTHTTLEYCAWLAVEKDEITQLSKHSCLLRNKGMY